MREELYAQCLDEMIRQVTINCAERGLLLLRIRDEMRMTIQAYQTLYESSVAFGVRKALQTEQGKSDMEARILQARSSITLVPIRPRSRCGRRSLRTLPVVSLRPGSLAFNPRPRCLSTPLLTPFNSTPTFARMDPRPSAGDGQG